MNIKRNSLAWDGQVYLAIDADGTSITGQIISRAGARLTTFTIENAVNGSFLGWPACAGRAGSDRAFAVVFVRYDTITNPKVVRFVRYRDGAITISDAFVVAELGTEVQGADWGQVRWTGDDWAIAIRLRDAREPRAVLVRMTDAGGRQSGDLTDGQYFANGQALAVDPEGHVVACGFMASHSAYYHDVMPTAIPNPNPALSVEDHQLVYREHLDDVLACWWGAGVGLVTAINGRIVADNLAPQFAGGLAMAYSPATRKTLVVAKTSAESTAIAFLIGDDGRPIADDVLTIAPWDGAVPAFYQSLVAGPAGEFAASTFLSPQVGGSRVDIINTTGARLAFGAGAGGGDELSDLKPLIDVANANGIPWELVALGVGVVVFVALSRKS